MGQVRNLPRGTAFTLDARPATVLSALDAALAGLGVMSIASAVLARLDPGGSTDGRTLHWSNAGHPPPALVEPNGSVRLLSATPNLLLGLEPGMTRDDHSVALGPGSSVVLYTDRLIERRGANLDTGLAWLVERLTGQGDLDAEALADHLLDGMPPGAEDDVALLVLQLPRVSALRRRRSWRRR